MANRTPGNESLPGASYMEKKVAGYVIQGGAVTLQELGDTFIAETENLISDRYREVDLRVGNIKTIPDGAQVFVVLDDEKHEVMAAIACIDGEEARLPIYELYEAEINKFLTENDLSGSVHGFELGRLANKGKSFRDSLDSLGRLFAASVKFALDKTTGTNKTPFFFITVNPDHESFYIKSFGFRKITSEQKDHAVGKPSVALYLDVSEWARRNVVSLVNST